VSVDDFYKKVESARLSSNPFETIDDTIRAALEAGLPQDCMVMGRDNAKFHLIILPSILLGLDLPVPEGALIHGMITDPQGRKFSKSLGNGVELEDFLEKYGVNGVRFLILHECNSVGDTAFNEEHFIASYNANLADNFGNLVVRVTNLVEKYCGGVVDIDSLSRETLEAHSIIDISAISRHLYAFAPDKAFRAFFEQSTLINRYLEDNKPWTLSKDEANKEKVVEILTVSMNALIGLTEMLSYFLPDTSEKIHASLTNVMVVKAPAFFEKVGVEQEL
jgi:methionyl-tRNA synthetase